MNGFKIHSEARRGHCFYLFCTCLYSVSTHMCISINNVRFLFQCFWDFLCPLQAPHHSPLPWQLEAGLLQPWRISPCSRGSGLRWPSCWRSGDPVTSRPSSCLGCPVGQPPTQVGTAPSAAALEDAARPPHC